MITPSVTFDLNSQSPTFGKMLISIQDPNFPTTPGYSVNLFLQITNPLGTVIKLFPNTADVSIIDSSLYQLPNIVVPTVTNGDFMEGNYLFEFKLDASSAPLVASQNYNFDLDVYNQGKDDCRIIGNVEMAANCLTGELSVKDVTDYKDGIVTLRVMDLHYPNIPNVTTPASLTTANAALLAPISYSNVSYSVALRSVYEHTHNNGVFVVIEDINGNATEKVVCKHNLCELLSCIEKFYKNFKEEAAQKGGIDSISQEKRDRAALLSYDLELFKQFKDCGDFDKAREYYDKIMEVVGCKCGCSGQNLDEAIPIVPIGLSPTHVQWGAWVEMTQADVPSASDITISSNDYPLRYRINSYLGVIQFDGKFVVNTAATPPSLGHLLQDTPVQNINPSQLSFVVAYDRINIKPVGLIRPVPTGTPNEFRFAFIPDVAYSPSYEVAVSGMMPI